ncbi:uncharacterized protein LOC105282467 isoform X2 [Ooceraea biroi]|uniref:uncharacterized protein LOC105282467 isoform X2 n=1 Tax=Ooceraea biroi TaxID=2015173 RepID=UPI0009716215|nr:uncharacterized protein LOC105282467 isoform X2 [Ooceraea biroi]
MTLALDALAKRNLPLSDLIVSYCVLIICLQMNLRYDKDYYTRMQTNTHYYKEYYTRIILSWEGPDVVQVCKRRAVSRNDSLNSETGEERGTLLNVYASDPQMLCKPDDVVLTKRLLCKKNNQFRKEPITEEVVEVLYSPDITDSVTGMEIIRDDKIIDPVNMYRELFEKSDYPKLTPGNRLEDIDFTNKKMFVEYEDSDDNSTEENTGEE